MNVCMYVCLYVLCFVGVDSSVLSLSSESGVSAGLILKQNPVVPVVVITPRPSTASNLKIEGGGIMAVVEVVKGKRRVTMR